LLIPVLLCGGVGKRLWPISRKSLPKQFVKLVDPNLSLFQITTQRLNNLNIKKSGWIVVANSEHRFIVADQLKSVNANVNRILLEPFGKNTAPAITISAIEALKISPNAKLLIQTSDHLIPDTEYFCNLICNALKTKLPIVTFGITPTSPETGYGYIKLGNQIINTTMFEINEFVEKPSLALAKRFLKSGQYFWNSGMFLIDAKIYLEELKKLNPDLYFTSEKAVSNAIHDLDFIRIDEENFNDCPDISIDHAFMEKTSQASVIPFVSKWSDLGAWQAVLDEMQADKDGNVIIGDGIAYKTSNTLIRSEGRLVTTLGVENLIVTETPDVVFVASKNASQEVSKLVEVLKTNQRTEADEHVIGYRPWGYFQSVVNGNGFKVKKITVKPGKALSLQSHKFRSEHWVVVEGTAEIINGNQHLKLNKNESTYISVGEKHRLINPGLTNLVLIEVQIGEYLEEDDIVRYEDVYGRV